MKGCIGDPGVRSLTTCEVCGMWWTAKKHELCPRCDLDAARQRVAALQRTAGRLAHELDMVVGGHR